VRYLPQEYSLLGQNSAQEAGFKTAKSASLTEKQLLTGKIISLKSR
jgi:hypothetical protein